MLVFAEQDSNRLRYVLDFIGHDLFGEQILLTTSQEDYEQYTGPKINYTQQGITSQECWIKNTPLLFETGIRPQQVQCFELNGRKAFFETAGFYRFDIFAAIFYLLSRYEEYLPHLKDQFGRYAHTNPLAFKENFLHQPLINFWLKEFKNSLAELYPALEFKTQHFTFQPTYDIDIAWSYLNKGWLRNVVGFLRSLLSLDVVAFTERLKVLFKQHPDPFDCYDWLYSLHQTCEAEPVYFFLLADRQIGYDKNINPEKEKLQQLIQQHDERYTVGIHPSWQSGDNDRLVKQEIGSLEAMVAHTVSHSRQHYLRFTIPVTYQNLIANGIQHEYSMGYGTINGFRASVASNFYWYDLEKESTSTLLIHPFCFMDATAFYQLKLQPEDTLAAMNDLYLQVREVNGLMTTLWHNNFLGTDRSFRGWRQIYEQFLLKIKTPAMIQ